MRADVDVQTQNVLKEICGFINAEGGTLYIGVNDDGLASGLEQDFAIWVIVISLNSISIMPYLSF